MIELGRYQHYKGNFYEVLFLANHSENSEELVIYKSLSDGKIWARPKKMFIETVLIDGKKVPRFKHIV